ncbi:MAG: ElyC/SanA/YdcF family protein [Paenibacillaceae bacterium]
MNNDDIDLLRQANDLNQISAFLALRDIPQLTREELSSCYGIDQADLLLVLGSSVISTIEIAAKAIEAGLAKELMIIGGRGHSTSYLVEALQQSPSYKAIPTEHRSEAEILLEIAVRSAKLQRDDILLETESTHCGNNASYAWEKLVSLERNPRSILIMQDPTMQLRSYASFKRVWQAAGVECQWINFAVFVPNFRVNNEHLHIEEHDLIQHAWDVDRLVSLIMGEIPRLRDDENGYGPRGRGFIEHVDIPEHIEEAYKRLLQDYALLIRNPS